MEVYGFPTVVNCADIAAKAADVKVIAFDRNRPFGKFPVPLIMQVKIEGSVSAVRSAIEAATNYAKSVDKFIVSHIIANPGEGVEKMAYRLDINKDKFNKKLPKTLLGSKEPIIKNPIIKKINNKILSYIERLPESSKISKPVIMNFDDGIVGFVVDKTKKEGTFVSLKMVKGFEKIESFDSIKTPFMALEFTLNKNGQMTKGMYYDMPGRMNAIFTRDARNVRRIQYANAFYKPVAENENLWLKMVPEVGEYQYASSANKMEFRDNEIQEYFSELAKKNVSVFAK